MDSTTKTDYMTFVGVGKDGVVDLAQGQTPSAGQSNTLTAAEVVSSRNRDTKGLGA